MTAPTLRHRAYEMLEPEARDREGLTLTNRFIILVILIACGAAIIETEPSIAAGRTALFYAIELGCGLVFSVEYLARLWIVPENPRWRGVSLARLRYALTPAALVDLVAVLPTLMALGFGGSALMLRFFRVIRILRLAKLGRLSRAWTNLVDALRDRRHELMLTIVLSFIVLLVGSTLLYWAEGAAQPAQFGSIPRAMWGCIVTLTTVGYGDVFPVTLAGKVAAGLIAVAGIGLFALLTGILAAAFGEAVQRHREAAAIAALDAAAEAIEDDSVDAAGERARAEAALEALEKAEKVASKPPAGLP